PLRPRRRPLAAAGPHPRDVHRRAATAARRRPAHGARLRRDQATDPPARLLGPRPGGSSMKTQRRKRLDTALGILLPLVIVALAFVAWDVVVRVFTIQPYVMPKPSPVFHSLRSDWSVLGPDSVNTIKEVVLGFAIGTSFGFVLAVLMAHITLVRRGLYPILIASQAVPIIAIGAPL